MKPFVRKIPFVVLMLAPVTVFAGADTQQPASFNPVLLGLTSMIVVLAGVIAFLAYVYLQLAFAYRDKFSKERSSGGIAKTVLLSIVAGLCSVNVSAQEIAGSATDAAVLTQESPFVSGIPRMDFYILVTIIGLELLFAAVFLGMIYRIVRILRGIPEKNAASGKAFVNKLMHRLTNAVAVKEEARIVLDHDYDGIHELDNSLPPWWKWGFAFTIVFAFAYMWYYHVSDGPNQAQEYAIAVEKAEREKAVYMARVGHLIDENNVTLIDDKSELANAGVLFKNTCAACHREDAGGSVGPNLTDNYWLHGGQLQDVFKSIKYGWKDKGMPEWGHNMSAKQIASLTTYVKNLSGKNVPGGKAPQGDLFTESNHENAADTAGKAEQKLTSIATEAKKQKG